MGYCLTGNISFQQLCYETMTLILGGFILIKKQQLIDGFTAIGVRKGMELEVHSSLSSFGYVDGGAETVIAALKECCDGGSIFMPALRLSHTMTLSEADKKMGITTKQAILPENCDRSAMGVIADTFRHLPDTQTGTGLFRIAGWGRNADKAVSGGLDHVIHHGGKALLLGVDIYKLTAMHYVEGIMPPEIQAIFAPNESIRAIYPPDQWLVETGAPPVKAWYTIQQMADERNLIQRGQIGDCEVMFFDIWRIVELYEQELKRDPFELYGIR